jgi:hypothetical protein
LPALFWLWANLDPQFILGLLLLAIFLLAEIVERLRCHSNPTRIPLVHLAVITGACLVAVLLTPYSIRLMPAAIQTVYSPVLFNNFASMSPMSFRAPEHFVLTFLVVAACFGLGRQHSLDLFKILLLAIFAILSFRVQKDNWTVAFVAIAVLGEASLALQDAPVASASVRSLKSNLQLATGVVIVLIALFLRFPTNQTLDHRLESVMPAKACDYIRSNSLPAPLFNEYRWGGYVMWKLPQYPVAIDERTNLYGDEGSAAYFEVVMGKKRMETLPSFSSAQTILLPVGLTMTKALTTLPVLKEQFREVYRDDVAVVLVRRYPLPAPFAASFASTQDK